MDDRHLEDVLGRQWPQATEESMLPAPGTAYQAFGRAASQPVCTLHCGLGKEGYRSFAYLHLDSDSRFSTDGGGHVIVIRFAGLRPVQLTIRGRNLVRLYDSLHQHRTPWIMRADRDFTEGDDPVVTAIEFDDVKDT